MDQQRIVWALSTFLLLAVQLNVAAQEVTIQIARLTTAINCGAGEHHLAIVKASMPNAGTDGNGSGFGFALVPAKGDVKMFARYWFFFPGKVLNKRDDDKGTLGNNLLPAQQTFKANVENFLGDCSLAHARPIIVDALDHVTTDTSVADVIKTLSASGLQFGAVTETRQNLGNPLTDSERSYVAISEVARTAVRQQAAVTASQAPSPEVATGRPDQSEEIKKNIKELETKIDSLSGRNRQLLILLITAGSLIVALVIAAIVLLYLKPGLRRRILYDPETTTEITQRIVSALRIIPPPDTKERDGAGSMEKGEITAYRDFISGHFGRKFLDQDVHKGLKNLADELNQNLLPLAGNDSNGASPTLDRLKSAREQVQAMWETFSTKPCPSGALTRLQKDWSTLQNTFQPFKQNDFQGVLSYARKSVTLFQFLSETFNQTHNPEDLKHEIEKLLKDLQNIHNDFTRPEQRYSLSPASLLVDLREKLSDYKRTKEKVITSITKVLPDASGEIDEMTAALVAKFNSNSELVSSTEALKAFNEKLKGERESFKTQAQESTQLAGALSHYVHLSTDTQLDSSQVKAILQRFTAGGTTHRQLRLRLAAALEALDQAVETVRNAGGTDALEALKISDFKNHLDRVLANLENFAGEDLWNKCLYSGFSERWLHNLFRADLVASTYFADDDSLKLLIAPLSEAATALRAAIREFDVRVSVLTLLSDPPAEAIVRYEVDPKLKELPGYRQKTQARWEQRKQGEDPKFIVDVELFPWQSDTNGSDGVVVAISGSQ